MNEGISIIGGGPAGCSVGFFLAKEGFDRITLYEKHPNKRKACGGSLGWRVLNRYDEFVKDVYCNKIRKYVFDFDGKILEFCFKKDVAAIVDRFEFDKNLRSIVESHGVKLVHKNMDMPKLQTRYVVDASGLKKSEKMGICMQGTSRIKLDCVKFVFRRNLFPYGYFWLFPISDDCTNVGLGGPKDSFQIPINRAFNSMLKKHKIKARGVLASPIAMRCAFDNLSEVTNSKSILRIGEAANLVNPASGEGIYHALRSGEIAANAIGGNCNYDTAIKDEFKNEFWLSEYMLKFMTKSPKLIKRSIALLSLKLINSKI